MIRTYTTTSSDSAAAAAAGVQQKEMQETTLSLAWLDLRQSVRWTALLGDWRYATQMEACWAMLRRFIAGHSAVELQVYQYVGDAVILHWDDASPLSAAVDCIADFRAWAWSEFGFDFRAVLHRGRLVRVEREGQLFLYGETLNKLFAYSQWQKHRAESFLLSADCLERLSPAWQGQYLRALERDDLWTLASDE